MIYPSNFEQKIGFDAVRQRLAKLCATSMGRSVVQDMTFSTDWHLVQRWLDQVQQMQYALQSDDALDTAQAYDIAPALTAMAVEGNFIPAADMHRVRLTLLAMDSVRRYCKTTSSESNLPLYPALADMVEGMSVFPGCISAINRVLDPTGAVADNASEALSDIRRQLRSMTGAVNAAMRRVMARAVADGILEPDAAPTVRDGRLVLPVAPMNKRRLGGIVHDESATGKTVYIEPAEVVEANNRLRELEIEEHREVVKVLTALCSTLRPEIPAMRQSLEALGQVDFTVARARYADITGGQRPTVSPEPQMEWYHACHPVLLESLQRHGKEIVPLSITLTAENRILVISGPNAGGKSVCLKTVGIVQYMAQCGLLPPLYANSHMGVFDGIFIDIGDNQSIEDELSTYSSHLRNMKLLLHKGRPESLLLIDEMGSGTEPQVGGALAQAILAQFNERGMWGVVTTHYQNLKHFADETEGMINGSMLYDRQHMQPLFKLSVGQPGSSFALEIARNTGLPASIIAHATELVGDEYVSSDRYLLDIARDRRYWENKRHAIRQKEKKVDDVLNRYEEYAEGLRAKRNEILSEAREQARKILESSNAAIERTIGEIRRVQAEREATKELRKGLRTEADRIVSEHSNEPQAMRKLRSNRRKQIPTVRDSIQSPTTDAALAVGQTVKLDGQSEPGKILSLEGANATVSFGMLRLTVPLSKLRATQAKINRGGGAASFVSKATTDTLRKRQLEFKQDIDVRGMRVDEGLQAITYFMDDAIQFSSQRVRILHGTGTGALRQAIRRYLDTVPGVLTYHDEDVRLGGAGITVVELQ